MPWNDNANPGPWGSPSSNDDRRDGPRRPQGGGPRRPDFDFDNLSRRLRDMMGGPGGPPNRRVLSLIGGGVVALWAASGFYIVQANEEAVVTTFGAHTRTETPGLRYHVPYPVERVTKVPVTSLQRIDIGGTRQGEASEESLMLTQDGNIVDLGFSVTWRVSDADQFVFRIRDPEVSIKAVAESAMREVVGRTNLDPLLTTGRGQLQIQTQQLMQRTLDSWGAGVSIVDVQIRYSYPPQEVAAAFRDVVNASQDAESAINEANTYRNRVVNEAKGDAARILQGAQAYREQAVREAQGEAARFNQILAEYKRAPGVTRDRLYIETMQRVLQSTNKVVIDAKGATAPIILPPDVFRPRSTVAPQAPPIAEVAPTQPQPKVAR